MRCRLFGHRWPDLWAKRDRVKSIDIEGPWWQRYQRVCLRCGFIDIKTGPTKVSWDGSFKDES